MAAVNALFDNFVVPKVVGNSVGLNPLLTMFVLLLGGTLFGLLGMLVAVPLAGSIQAVLMRRFPKLSSATPMMLYRIGKAKKEQVADNHSGEESLFPSAEAKESEREKRHNGAASADSAPVAPPASPIAATDNAKKTS